MQTDSQRTQTLASQAPALIKTQFQIMDRWSKFIGHSVHVTSRKDVVRVQAVLKANKEFKNATHNIQAWRFLNLVSGKQGDSPDDFVVEDGYDDDGETAAGRKLWIMMRDAGACDCMVIVTRWYGGTQLGPVRFDHINNVGKAALEAGGFIGAARATANQLVRPVDQVSVPQTFPEPILTNWKSIGDKDRLLRLLKARDGSIEGFTLNVTKQQVQFEANVKTIRILSRKLGHSGVEREAHNASDSVEVAKCDLTQDSAEQLLKERDDKLARLKTRLKELKEQISLQDKQIEDLSLSVAQRSESLAVESAARRKPAPADA
ncbi:ribosomal protein S5 domain 2-type protein [Obelidium mucronatum]|nr:ribosomal protein S5 domain 2-type protein [Obelidium mucronatum]